MNFNNSYMIYRALMENHNPGRQPLSIGEAIKESTFAFLQSGESMRKQVPEHLSAVRELRSIHDSGYRRKKWKDATDVVSSLMERERHNETTTTRLYRLRNQQKASTWRRHQSITSSTKKREQCQFEKCPGIAISKEKGVKRPRPRVANIYCEEYTAVSGKHKFLCNNKLKDGYVLCHIKYHN